MQSRPTTLRVGGRVCGARQAPDPPAARGRRSGLLEHLLAKASPSGRCSPAPSGGRGENRPWVAPGHEGVGPARVPRGGGRGRWGRRWRVAGSMVGGTAGEVRWAGWRGHWWARRESGETRGEGEGGRQVSGMARGREGGIRGGWGGRVVGRRASGSQGEVSPGRAKWGREMGEFRAASSRPCVWQWSAPWAF